MPAQHLEAEHLRRNGCSFGQRFHLERPMPSRQIHELLVSTGGSLPAVLARTS